MTKLNLNNILKDTYFTLLKFRFKSLTTDATFLYAKYAHENKNSVFGNGHPWHETTKTQLSHVQPLQ